MLRRSPCAPNRLHLGLRLSGSEYPAQVRRLGRLAFSGHGEFAGEALSSRINSIRRESAVSDNGLANNAG